jgi:hypothetical protein
MRVDSGLGGSNTMVATIENDKDPTQSISIHYLREENAFVTSGIKAHFDEKEILIPAHLMVIDLQLIGTVVSAILEKLSQAHDRDGTFEYVPQFDVIGRTYTLVAYGDYMRLSEMVD